VVVSQQRLANFDDIVHNSLEAERGFDKASKEGSTTFDRKRCNFVDKHYGKLKPGVLLRKERSQVHPELIQLARSVVELIRGNDDWVPTIVMLVVSQDTTWQTPQTEGIKERMRIRL